MDTATDRIRTFFAGILVGIGSMLPGISGAVMAVCFGIYERLISDLADVVHKIRSDFVFILIVAIGIIIGMVGVSFGLKYMLDNFEIIAMFFFLGLIVGQLPELFNLTNDNEKITKYNAVAFIIGFLIMMVFLVVGAAEDIEIKHDLTSVLLMIGVGIILAISKLAPGISGSTVLLALGLYYPFTAAMTDFDMFILVPILIGLIVGILGFAKVMDYALRNHRKTTYCAIFGLTIGSIPVVFDYAISDGVSTTDWIFGIIAIVLGIGLSLLFSRIGKPKAE